MNINAVDEKDGDQSTDEELIHLQYQSPFPVWQSTAVLTLLLETRHV